MMDEEDSADGILGIGRQRCMRNRQHNATVNMPFAMRNKYILQDLKIWQ